ncbi:MAG: GTP-binding protein, partial [Burkholderiaceae bacterium]
IYAALIAATGADSIALSNGCVCCSIGDDLTAALMRVLDAEPPFDAVVIEASGVSDPWRIAQVGLADPGLGLDGVLVLLDADAALEQAADPLLADSLQRQLRAADLIVVNKTDLVDTASLQRVRDWLETLLPDTPRFETAHGALPPALREGARMPRARAGASDDSACGSVVAHAHAHGHGHEHEDQFETWSARPDEVLSAAALRAALRAMPAGVLRLKGLLRTDEIAWAEMQFAGRRGSLRAAREAPADGAALVAIGLRGRLPRKALDALLADTRIHGN